VTVDDDEYEDYSFKGSIGTITQLTEFKRKKRIKPKQFGFIHFPIPKEKRKCATSSVSRSKNAVLPKATTRRK
jgi:hypothetical protein